MIFRFGQSLHSILPKEKNPILVEQSKVMYQICCSCGKAYIGETRRRLKIRLKEHQDAVQKGTLEK